MGKVKDSIQIIFFIVWSVVGIVVIMTIINFSTTGIGMMGQPYGGPRGQSGGQPGQYGPPDTVMPQSGQSSQPIQKNNREGESMMQQNEQQRPSRQYGPPTQ